MIREFNEAQGGEVLHALDVYPMSILRRDGHVGGKDCRQCSVANDCFYYSLPGPSDWWNHLMLSNIVDMNTRSEK